MDVVRYLLESDPAIRWQAMRDLTHESDATVAAERARVATEGWGAASLAAQGATVTSSSTASAAGPRTCTRSSTSKTSGSSPFFDVETEPCINGAVVGIGAYFGEGRATLVDRLLAEQLDDGGWNCDAPPKPSAARRAPPRFYLRHP